MEKFEIHGGRRLNGTIKISGAKNAAVAIIPAVILSDGICRIENLPDINDVVAIAQILKKMGECVKHPSICGNYVKYGFKMLGSFIK